ILKIFRILLGRKSSKKNEFRRRTRASAPSGTGVAPSGRWQVPGRDSGFPCAISPSRPECFGLGKEFWNNTQLRRENQLQRPKGTGGAGVAPSGRLPMPDRVFRF